MKLLRWTPLALLAIALLVLPGCGDSGDPDEKKAVDAPSGGGLKYFDMQEGQGDPVKEGDTIAVRYTGKLKADGKQFDSNTEPGKKLLQFQVGAGAMIKGFDLGVVGMKPGGKRKIHVPKEFIVLERTLLLLMGLCTELDPQLEPMTVIRPYVERFVLGDEGDW